MIRVKLKISIFALIDSISLINQRTMTIQQLEYIHDTGLPYCHW